jgi:hypothetical protein
VLASAAHARAVHAAAARQCCAGQQQLWWPK